MTTEPTTGVVDAGEPDEAARRGARRESTLAVLVLLVGAALLGLASAGTWARATGGRPIGGGSLPLRVAVGGQTVIPWLGAAAFLGLAGGLAVPATRRLGRVVAGVVVAGTGLVTLGAVVDRWSAAAGLVRRRLPADAVAVSVHTNVYPVVAVLGGLVLLLGGIWLVLRGPHWAALSTRYETPGARSAAAKAARAGRPGDVGTWDALDRGEDPTAPAPGSFVPPDDAPDRVRPSQEGLPDEGAHS